MVWIGNYVPNLHGYGQEKMSVSGSLPSPVDEENRGRVSVCADR